MKKPKHTNSYIFGSLAVLILMILIEFLPDHVWLYVAIGFAVWFGGYIWRWTKDKPIK